MSLVLTVVGIILKKYMKGTQNGTNTIISTFLRNIGKNDCNRYYGFVLFCFLYVYF